MINQKTNVDQEKNETDDELNFSIFSSNILAKITEEIPYISTNQVFSYENRTQIASDQCLFHVCKSLACFADDKEMNLAMNLLKIAIHVSATSEVLSTEIILHSFMAQNDKDPSILGTQYLDEIRAVLSKLIGNSQYHPIYNSHNGLVISQIGMLVFEYYQKMKAEILVLYQDERMKPILEIFMQFRTLLNYEGQNLEMDWIFAAIINLRKLINILQEDGEIIYKDEKSGQKIEKIHLLIKKMQDYHELNKSNKRYTITDHTNIGREIIQAFSWLFEFYIQNFRTQAYHVTREISDSPFPLMKKMILENWNDFDWDIIYFQNENAFSPIKINMPVSHLTIEKNVLKYLLSSKKEIVNDLPTGEIKAELKPHSELKIREEENLILREKLRKKLPDFWQKTDFDMAQTPDPIQLLRRLTVIHELCYLKHYASGEEEIPVSSKKLHIKHYGARKILQLQGSE